ncbi:MAG: hypothetical protein H5T97_01895, partial [Firmicutes bacterium]|nr:hypothetical protein [Bacillota bacterium]
MKRYAGVVLAAVLVVLAGSVLLSRSGTDRKEALVKVPVVVYLVREEKLEPV